MAVMPSNNKGILKQSNMYGGAFLRSEAVRLGSKHAS